MSEKFQEEEEKPFQTAFPEDTETDEQFDARMNESAKPTQLFCQYGCGQPGQYFGDSRNPNELPRCAKRMTDCPAVKRGARRVRR